MIFDKNIYFIKRWIPFEISSLFVMTGGISFFSNDTLIFINGYATKNKISKSLIMMYDREQDRVDIIVRNYEYLIIGYYVSVKILGLIFCLVTFSIGENLPNGY